VKVKDLPKHKQPREKLIEKGPQNLRDEELLAILLRTGREGKNVVEMSREILIKFPMKRLLAMDLEAMVKVKGINVAKATTLLAGFELTKRALEKFEDNLPILDSPRKVVDQLMEIRNKKKEHLLALYVNSRNQMIAREIISVGTLNCSLVHPREVFEPAVRQSAAGIIVAHNHPSGSLEPSVEDKTITKQLVQAGEILGVDLIDHVIVTGSGYVSMKEENLL